MNNKSEFYRKIAFGEASCQPPVTQALWSNMTALSLVSPLLKKETVLEVCTISKSTLYRLIKAGEFPEPVSLGGGRSVAWRADEVAAWIESRPKVRLSSAQKHGGTL